MGDIGVVALLWLGSSLLLASVVRAMTGWAFSIIAVPLLSLVFPPDQAVVLNILLALAATLKNVPAMRGQISRRIFLPLLFSGLVGTPAGYWLHTMVSDAGLRLGMGLLVLALSAAMLLIPPRPRALTLPALALAGLASGVLGGAVGIAGPPVVLLFVLTATDMGQARATLALGLLSVCLLAAGAYLLGGRITQHVLLLFALALPVVLLGDTLGNRLFARYGGHAARRVSVALTCAVGLLSMARSMLGP
ncbi:MAG: sulfite exporter TauE/SafE family protein [Rhodoferax sp.]|nr:sulfite exporter TauE/SafE family protein [Rhodoferax sp.]